MLGGQEGHLEIRLDDLGAQGLQQVEALPCLSDRLDESTVLCGDAGREDLGPGQKRRISLARRELGRASKRRRGGLDEPRLEEQSSQVLPSDRLGAPIPKGDS